ncbi:hypothetical protein IT411_02530 [Candidatus Peregrinibacteria bacterium]|nr:hypothetical protein [Candidatus Peregrinibacteria bacterium]
MKPKFSNKVSEHSQLETDIQLLNEELRIFIQIRVELFSRHEELYDLAGLMQKVMVIIAMKESGEKEEGQLIKAMLEGALNTIFVGAALANPQDRALIKKIVKENSMMFATVDKIKLEELFDQTPIRVIPAGLIDDGKNLKVELNQGTEDFADIDRYVNSIPTKQIRLANNIQESRAQQFRNYLENEYGPMIEDVVKTFGDFDLEDGIVVEKGLPLRTEIMNALETLPLIYAIRPQVISEVIMAILADRYSHKYGRIVFGLSDAHETAQRKTSN